MALTLFNPKFWRLLVKTIELKWLNRHQGSLRYTDHLIHYYRRENNPYWESIDDKWKPIRSLMVQFADLRPGDKVLDIATGVGFQAAEFSTLGFQATGLDLVYDRAKLAKQKHDDTLLSWVVADAAQLPIMEKSFDVVTISLALHDMPLNVIKEVLKEVRRVGRRKVIIVEPRLPELFVGKYLYVSLATVFDESVFIREFLWGDLETLLKEASLKLTLCRRCFYNILTIYVCEL